MAWNPGKPFQQAGEASRLGVTDAILNGQNQKEESDERVLESQRDHAPRTEKNYKKSLRRHGAKRPTPYSNDFSNFLTRKGFGRPEGSFSGTEMTAGASHGEENFETFLRRVRGVGGPGKTPSEENLPKLDMSSMARGFENPRKSAVDELFDYAQNFDNTLLEHIKLGNNVEIYSRLQDVNNPHQLTDSVGTTLLHFAARYGNRDFAQHLIDLGATVDAQNWCGETPLMYAVQATQEATTRLLVDCNADILLSGFVAYCALGEVLAHRQNFSDSIVTSLLGKVTVESLNASEYVKTEQFHRSCPLYHFIRLKNVEITRCLLQNGSPINATSELGETALHVAAELLDLENVQLLIQFGADVNAPNSHGNTPMTSIQDLEDYTKVLPVVRILVAAGATMIDDLSSARTMEWPILSRGNREIVRTVLQCPIDLHSMNQVGLSPLHYLARNRHVDVLEELRDFYFDANVRCGSNATMLHHAASVGNASSVEFLLKVGVEVDARDGVHQTPLVWAMYQGIFAEDVDDYLRCIEVLLDRGARPHVIDVSVFLNLALIEHQLGLGTKPVLARLALLEASGQVIEDSMRNEIESCRVYRSNFDLAKLQLEEMKRIVIYKSVSLFDFLIASDEKISMYARNKKWVFNLTNVMQDCNSESYCNRRLRNRFLKVAHLAEMRDRITVVFDEILSTICDLNVYNVAKNIVNYVDDQELYTMSPNLQ